MDIFSTRLDPNELAALGVDVDAIFSTRLDPNEVAALKVKQQAVQTVAWRAGSI